MDLKQIKELMAAMEKAGMKKIMIKEKTGFELHLERECEVERLPAHHPVAVHPGPVHFMPQAVRGHDFPAPSSMSEEKPAASKSEVGKSILSPMVGTFYGSPSPDDPSFVKVGDRVDENTVVCIIEAMKVMNEVKAGMAGVIAEVLLESGHPVEFGTKLFRIV